MKRFSSQFNKKAKHIRLSVAERADLRERLVSYMEYHPLPKEKKPLPAQVGIVSEPFKVFKFNYARLSGVMGSFAMIIVVAVPVLAEKALPGDVFYPVKVQFNEELRSTLAFSPYAKIEWETKRLERRLAEARFLADEGKLTKKLEAEVALAIRVHSDAAQEGIEQIRATDSDEAVIAEITLASALEVQSEVLGKRVSMAAEEGRSVAALASAIASARSKIDTSEDSTSVSYEKLLARLEAETTNSQELFASVKQSATAEQIVDIERRFDDIRRKINNSIALHIDSTKVPEDTLAMSSTMMTSTSSDVAATLEIERPNYEHEAKSMLRAALTDTHKLISFMTNIDVRNNVSIEELVPVQLTPEERAVITSARLESLQSRWGIVERIVPDKQLEEKFDVGKSNLFNTINAALASYAQSDYDTVNFLVGEGEMMVTDLMRMGTISELPLESTSSPTDSSSTSSNITEYVDIKII